MGLPSVDRTVTGVPENHPATGVRTPIPVLVLRVVSGTVAGVDLNDRAVTVSQVLERSGAVTDLVAGLHGANRDDALPREAVGVRTSPR